MEQGSWGGYRRIQAEILPDLPEGYLKRLDQLRGIYRERYKEGKWTAAEGLVYPFDPTKHIIPKFPIPKDWQRVVSIDFGTDHPFVCHWWAISPSDIWYLYRQVYHTYRSVTKHAGTIKTFCAMDEIVPVAICDHDAGARLVLEENGVQTIAAKKDRLAGQQDVHQKFENDQIFFFDGSLIEIDQRLVMEGRPTRTEDEFAGYIWATKGKEDMVKEEDDGMDTMRYAIYTMARLGAGTRFEPFVVG